MPAILLTDQDDERHPVPPCGRQCADGVAQPSRGVQDHQAWLVVRQRPAGSQPDDRTLVQSEYERQVVRQIGE
jgi:hypothetical protein